MIERLVNGLISLILWMVAARLLLSLLVDLGGRAARDMGAPVGGLLGHALGSALGTFILGLFVIGLGARLLRWMGSRNPRARDQAARGVRGGLRRPVDEDAPIEMPPEERQDEDDPNILEEP